MRPIVIGVVIIIAILAGYVAMQITSKPNQEIVEQGQPAITVSEILVAKQAIPVGTKITAEMVDKQPWPQHLVLNSFVVVGTENASVVDMIARSDFQEREPFMMSKLGNPSDGNFLAASLSKGMRAATVSVDAVTGVAGYVFPGDRVDVLVTHNVASEQSRKPNASEVLLSNVRVLATKLRNEQVLEDNNKEDRRSNRDNKPSTYTLEVTPDEAQKIRLAEKTGTLAVVLRSIKDSDEATSTTPTTVGELTKLEFGQQERKGVVVVRGTKIGDDNKENTQEGQTLQIKGSDEQ